MKERYENKDLGADSLDILAKATEILERYDVRMTVRQLYYQIVVTNAIPNTVASYKRLVRILRDGRMVGLLDWDHIEDRLRLPHEPGRWPDIDSIIRAALSQFQLDRWKGQDNYVEVWLEKDALAGIVGEVASEWQVTLQVNRGYSSITAMRDAARRFIGKGEAGKRCVLAYLGDHDPSGEDMVRDVGDRLAVFGAEVRVEKLAILQEDIERYSLPPQPVKDSDSRAGAFRLAHGDDCVELDALQPDVLQERVRSFILENLDETVWRESIDEEAKQRGSVHIGRRKP